MNVLRHGDAVYGYTCGWSRRVSVSVDTAIGLAISRDEGLTFQRIGDGPVLAASLHEPFLVGDGVREERRWRVPHVVHLRHRLEAEYAPRRAARANLQDRARRLARWRQLEQGGSAADHRRPIGAGRKPGAADGHPASARAITCSSAIGSRSTSGRTATAATGSATPGRTISFAGRATTTDPQSKARRANGTRTCSAIRNVFEIDGRVHLLYNGNEFGRHGFGLATLES